MALEDRQSLPIDGCTFSLEVSVDSVVCSPCITTRLYLSIALVKSSLNAKISAMKDNFDRK